MSEEKQFFENPLFLPEGSVRALLALGCLAGAFALVIKGVQVPEYIRDALLVIIGFYFGSRKK